MSSVYCCYPHSSMSILTKLFIHTLYIHIKGLIKKESPQNEYSKERYILKVLMVFPPKKLKLHRNVKELLKQQHITTHTHTHTKSATVIFVHAHRISAQYSASLIYRQHDIIPQRRPHYKLIKSKKSKKCNSANVNCGDIYIYIYIFLE